MGKIYSSELECLTKTYDWALNFDLNQATQFIGASCDESLLAVGSGGSLTAAHFLSLTHQFYTGYLSVPVTPLEMTRSQFNLKSYSVCIVSAGGNNRDIIGAFNAALTREPQRLAAFCARRGSKLSLIAKNYPEVEFLDFEIPSGSDGFLSTNSLFAFSTIFLRTYLSLFATSPLPTSLQSLIGDSVALRDLERKCEPLWERETLLVLHGVNTKPAAIDLESKFSEAAITPVLVSDFRNFAHGRHNWLAKRGQSTGVLAIVSQDDRDIAEKLLKQIPRTIPVVCIDVDASGPSACLKALFFVLHVTGFAGNAKQLNPGRGNIPKFGRRIYSQGVGIQRLRDTVQASKAAAMARKAFANGRPPYAFNLNRAYNEFYKKLESARFGSIIFDYDGTLCGGSSRFSGISDDMAKGLKRLLLGGIVIGVATGRGKSVRLDLQEKLLPSLWKRVVIGYYGGSDIALLSENDHPNSREESCAELTPIAAMLKSDQQLCTMASITVRFKQITIEANSQFLFAPVRKRVEQLTCWFSHAGILVLHSTHSVDILAPGVSKTAMIPRVVELSKGAKNTLCIGDRGAFPGNDYALLKHPYSLSVDQISCDPETCWNLAPPSFRGPKATQFYMEKCLSFEAPGSLRFRRKSS